MTHEEFLRGYRDGSLRVRVDRAGAARLVSGRLMLPLLLLPVLGLAVAAALVGYLLAGTALFLAAIGFRLLVRASSQGFVLNRALQDAAFYDEVVRARVLTIEAQ
jgi:hypothetical protein